MIRLEQKIHFFFNVRNGISDLTPNKGNSYRRACAVFHYLRPPFAPSQRQDVGFRPHTLKGKGEQNRAHSYQEVVIFHLQSLSLIGFVDKIALLFQVYSGKELFTNKS